MRVARTVRTDSAIVFHQPVHPQKKTESCLAVAIIYILSCLWCNCLKLQYIILAWMLHILSHHADGIGKEVIMKRIILTLMLVLGVASIAFAHPVSNDDGSDGYEDYNGTPYSDYVNSGEFLFALGGNTNDAYDPIPAGDVYSVLELQSVLRSADSRFSAVELTVAGYVEGNAGDYGIDLGGNGSSGTWATNPSSNFIEFYVVKGSDGFAMYYVNPADNTGSWSTYDLYVRGFSGNSLDISHFIGYNPSSAPVPEPGTILLIGVGLVGIGLYGRKRMKA
jgi:hypothetical protein